MHDIAHRLAPGCVPVFSGDGLALYFYVLTAHFGAWVQTLGERRRRWTVNAQVFAKRAQLIKRYRRRIAEVRYQVQLGTPEAYRLAVCALGFSGRIQTAFIERLNLTLRRSIAGLARQSWTLRAAHSLSELALHFEWWRAVSHFTRPHASLRQLINDNSTGSACPRCTCPTAGVGRLRTPAQAAGLVARRWSVQQLLTYPAPPLPSAG